MDTRPDPMPQPDPPMDEAERQRLVADMNALFDEAEESLERDGPADLVDAVRAISRKLGLSEPDLSAFEGEVHTSSP